MAAHYLVRHGSARPAAPGAADAERPLDDRGREEVTRVARHAAALGLRVAEIRHSGFVRARESAEILAAHLHPPRGVREAPGLRPNEDPRALQAELEAAEPLMLVGHLPHLGRLASLLLVGDPDREILRIRAAAVICLGYAEGRWGLEWMLTPALAGDRG